MDKTEKPKTRLLPFIAASMAPAVVFALAFALFLPIAGAMIDLNSSFLGSLLSSINNPLVSRLILVVFMLFLPITAVAALVSPALTSFIVNLKYSIMMNWLRAILGGIVFFFFYAILLVILIVVRNSTLPPLPANYPFPSPTIDPLAIFGLLAGVVMSCSVTIFGWLGARMKRRRRETQAN